MAYNWKREEKEGKGRIGKTGCGKEVIIEGGIGRKKDNGKEGGGGRGKSREVRKEGEERGKGGRKRKGQGRKWETEGEEREREDM